MSKGRDPTEKLQSEEPCHCNGDVEKGDKRGCLNNTMFRNPAVRKVAGTFVAVFVGMMIVIIILAVLTSKPCATPPEQPAGPWCPKGWIGYEGKCYHFSNAEGSWTYSQSNCSSLRASLAVIDNEQELIFIQNHKSAAEHWIGLSSDPDSAWKWVNGQEFNNTFEVKGGGECAYLNDVVVGSSWCDSSRHWVCSRAGGQTEAVKAKTLGK